MDAARQTAIAYQETVKTDEGIWMPLLFVASLAGCQTDAPSCAGWQKIPVKPATAVYLAGNDVPAGQGIASHNAFGKTRKCW